MAAPAGVGRCQRFARGGEYPRAAVSSVRGPRGPPVPLVTSQTRGRERPLVRQRGAVRAAESPEVPALDVPFWVWALTIGAIVGMLVFDFVGHVRTPHAPSLRESAIWSAVYIGIAVVFGLLVLWFAGGQYAGEYFAGYVTEKSLSVDNLFVFVLIMASFAVLGLRQLFFLIDGLLDRLVYLSFGLAVILGFIGVKLLIHALHENELPFINGGEHVTVIPEVPTWLSLSVILVTLVVTTVASLLKNRRDAARGVEAPPRAGGAAGGPQGPPAPAPAARPPAPADPAPGGPPPPRGCPPPPRHTGPVLPEGGPGAVRG